MVAQTFWMNHEQIEELWKQEKMKGNFMNRIQAEEILKEAEVRNPGPWANHCRIAAKCAEQIAIRCGMDAELAYVMGLLHDIGRRYGVGHFQHVYDGWKYMLEMGEPEIAQICLTHSFVVPALQVYIGRYDVTEEQKQEAGDALVACEYTEYDRLIQLCDCLAGTTGVMDMEERMEDVKARYGTYPQEKWDGNMQLKAMFEEKMGMDIYEVLTDVQL